MLTKITKQDIYRLSVSRDVFLRGNKIFTNDGVSDMELDYAQGAEIISVTTLSVNGRKAYNVRIFVSLDSNTILGHMCKCGHHEMWRGPCEHVIAALFYIAGGKLETLPIPALTEKALRVFERAYLAELERVPVAQDEQVRLYPRLHLSDGLEGAALSFTIGREKRYVLKNIAEFLTNIDSHSTVSYGRSLEFKHTPGVFDERTLKMIGLMRRMLKSLGEFSQMVRIRGVPVVDRHMPLVREIIDKFFELYLDSEIEVATGDGQTRGLVVTKEPPKAMFSVSYDGGLPIISADRTDFIVLPGRRRDYFIDDSVHIVRAGYAQMVNPLLNTILETRHGSLCVRREDIHSFLTAALPALQGLGAVERAEAPPVDFTPLTTEIYLDYAARNINCTVKFRYGELELNPLKPSKPANIRDRLQERRVLTFLADMGFEKKPPHYTLTGDSRIYELYTSGLARLRELAEVFTTDEFVRKSYIPTAKAHVGVRLSGNLLELDFESPYTAAELLETLEACRLRKRYHRLTDGRFVDISSIEEAAEVLDSFDISKKDVKKGIVRLPKYRAMYLNSILQHKTATLSPEFSAMVEGFNNSGGYEVPSAMAEVLRPYQRVGYDWLRTLADYGFGGILADEMGLGKTIQIIALILAELKAYKNPSVVVAPTSLLYNWEREFGRFAPELSVIAVAGTPERRKALLQEQAHVYITTYDTLKRDIDNYAPMRFKYVVADEAQYMKNPSTRNAAAVKSLNAEARYALTGTPVENALSELWSIFDFVMPGYLYSPSKFTKMFESPIVKNGDSEKAARLQKQISPFVLRRLKRDVLTELPDKVETNLYAGMEDEQRRLYTAFLSQARGELDSATQIEILTLLTRLRQICCHPALFAEDYKGGSGKLELALDTLASATESGHRALLFSQFTSMLGILTARLRAIGIDYFYLDGKTPASERLSMTERFNAGERPVFVISLKAGGTGLNLTGADVVMHYDPWWNPAVMDQATDRAHRYGQDKTVQVINLVTRDSIEERILALQERKKGLVDSVITEGGSFLNRMTAEELRELFAE